MVSIVVVAAFNQERALVGAFSVITNLLVDIFEALVAVVLGQPQPGAHFATEISGGMREGRSHCLLPS